GTTNKLLLSVPQCHLSSDTLGVNGGASGSTPPSAFSRNKPRSRSLIRRSSKKAKQQVRDAQPDECSLS
ncbi:hypothetical protein Pcinc_038111, partial [Petrolisthes cinctipes]